MVLNHRRPWQRRVLNAKHQSQIHFAILVACFVMTLALYFISFYPTVCERFLNFARIIVRQAILEKRVKGSHSSNTSGGFTDIIWRFSTVYDRFLMDIWRFLTVFCPLTNDISCNCNSGRSRKMRRESILIQNKRTNKQDSTPLPLSRPESPTRGRPSREFPCQARATAKMRRWLLALYGFRNIVMDARTAGRTDGRTDGRVDRRMDGRTDL